MDFGHVRPDGVGPEPEHRGLQHPVPAHGLPGRLRPQAARVRLSVPSEPLRPRARGLDHPGRDASGRCRGSCSRCRTGAVWAVGVDGLIYGFRSNLGPGKRVGGSSEQRASQRTVTRKEAVVAALAGAGALALPSFLVAEEALGAPLEPRWPCSSARTSFPVPPEERQAAHLGLPVLQRRLRLQDLHLAGEGDAQSPGAGGPVPQGGARRLDLARHGHADHGGRGGQLRCRRPGQGLHRQQGRPLAPGRHQRPDRLHHAQAPAYQPDGAPPPPAGPGRQGRRAAPGDLDEASTGSSTGSSRSSTAAGLRPSASGAPTISRRR